MIDSGKLSLGIPCAPFSLTHYQVVDGELKQQDKTIHGRKFPLKELRQKLLTQQEKHMRLLSDEEIEQMTPDDLHTALKAHDHGNHMTTSTRSTEELQADLKRLQRTRSLALWHDHATILGLGMVIVMVHVLYDSFVFLTKEESSNKHRQQLSNQSYTLHPLEHLHARIKLY